MLRQRHPSSFMSGVNPQHPGPNSLPFNLQRQQQQQHMRSVAMRGMNPAQMAAAQAVASSQVPMPMNPNTSKMQVGANKMQVNTSEMQGNSSEMQVYQIVGVGGAASGGGVPVGMNPNASALLAQQQNQMSAGGVPNPMQNMQGQYLPHSLHFKLRFF